MTKLEVNVSIYIAAFREVRVVLARDWLYSCNFERDTVSGRYWLVQISEFCETRILGT